MIEVRFHGRGGQGAVTSAEMVALAAIEEGKFAQGFPSFGPERRGAPVIAFARVDDKPIRLRSKIYQPDVAVVRRPWSGYPRAHPGPGDILLLIEVADSSLELDLGAKRTIYARAGIGEYWIVDLTTDTVLLHREPDGDGYRGVTPVKPPAVLEVRALTGVAIPAGAIFT